MFAQCVIYPVKTEAFCPPPQPRLLLFFNLFPYFIIRANKHFVNKSDHFIPWIPFHASYCWIYVLPRGFFRIKCLISFTCREFGSHQQQSGIQLCIQQQFSGGSHPSAFYSHDHRRLRSVPLQTQVEFTPAAFQQYNNASSLWFARRSLFAFRWHVGLTRLKRPNYWKLTSSNWCFCSARALQTSKLGNHDLRYERNDSFPSIENQFLPNADTNCGSQLLIAACECEFK